MANDALAAILRAPLLDEASAKALRDSAGSDGSASDTAARSAERSAGSASGSSRAEPAASGDLAVDSARASAGGVVGDLAGSEIGGDMALGNMGTVGDGGGRGDEHGIGSGGLLGARSAMAILNERCTVSGGYDKDLVRRVVRAHMNEVRGCYERRLEHDGRLAGRVNASFRFDHTGFVMSASAQPEDFLGGPTEADQVAECIQSAIRRWEFPRPPVGSVITVRYPFLLTALESTR